jgi:hypothetical protein
MTTRQLKRSPAKYYTPVVAINDIIRANYAALQASAQSAGLLRREGQR